MKLKSVKTRIKTWKRQLLAMLLIVIMLAGIMPQAYAYRYDVTPDCPDFSEVVWESTGTDDDGFTGVVSYADRDNGRCYSLGGTTYTQQLIKNFTEEEKSREYFKDNTMLLSVDLCAKQTDHALIFALNNYPLLMFNGKGTLSFVNQNGWPGADYVGDVSVSYDANKWYNIKLLIDGNLKRISCYINGEFWGNDSHNAAGFLNKDLDPTVTMENLLFNYHAEMTFKNGVQTQSDGSGMFLIDNIRIGHPKYNKTSVEVTTDEIGNMLVQGDTPINLDVFNNEDSDKKFTLDYEIRDAENYIHVDEQQTVSVKAGTKERVVINPKLKKCGFYYIKVKMSDKDGTVDTLKTRFSVIAKVRQNPRFGFSVHPITHGVGTQGEITELSVKLGAGVSREDFPWPAFFAADGVTISNPKSVAARKEYNKLLDDNNIESLMVLGPGPSNYGGYTWPPNADEIKNTNVLAAWKNYCRSLASALGGGSKAVYEVYNEWLVQERNTNATPEDYAELLKVSAEGLREGNPDCIIVGLCGALKIEEAWWDDRVLAALGDNPGQYFDAISIHPYLVWEDQYPEQSKIEDMQSYANMLKKYGLEDVPIYGTEYGCTTANELFRIDDSLQADYVLREFIMMDDFIDKHYFYTITRKRDSAGREAGFGITHKPTKEEIIYEAYPGALSYAMYNSLMTGAHVTTYNIFDYGNDDIKDDLYAYNFKLADGKDCIAMWNVGIERTQSVNVGAEKVTVYDRYGNQKILNAVDGYITLDIGTAPMFITAASLTEPQLRDEPIFEYDRSITTMLNNGGEIDISNGTAKDLTVEVTPSANITMEENTCTTLGAGKAGKIVIKTADNREKTEEYMFDDEDGSYDGLRVVLKDGAKVLFEEEVKVKYEDSIETRLNIVPYKNGIWQAMISVRNTNRVSPTNGTIELVNKGSTVYFKDIGGLSPGEKKIFRYIIPEELLSDSLTLTSKVKVEDGQQFEKTTDSKLTIICKSDKSPTIDGRMDAGEWKIFSTPLRINSSEFAGNLPGWKGPDDLSGDIYLMYDENYLYLGAKVKDNIHCGYDEKGRIWATDSIQFAVSDARVGDAKITEMGLGLMDDGAKFTRYISQHTGEEGFDINTFEDAEFAASLDGDITTYEFKMSWQDLFRNNFVPTDNLIFSILVNDNDGAGRRGWMEYGGGIGGAKDTSKFLEIPLDK